MASTITKDIGAVISQNSFQPLNIASPVILIMALSNKPDRTPGPGSHLIASHKTGVLGGSSGHSTIWIANS
jgi:hypothetical protein